MTLQPFQRILSIKAAAAGPYVIEGLCHDCGTDQRLVNFPRSFALAIAICRRCRFSRTGVEDRRGLIEGEAWVSRPLELSTPVTIRGLLSPGPPVFDAAAVDEILAPWNDAIDDPVHFADDSSNSSDPERSAQLEREIDALDRELDQVLRAIEQLEQRTR